MARRAPDSGVPRATVRAEGSLASFRLDQLAQTQGQLGSARLLWRFLSAAEFCLVMVVQPSTVAQLLLYTGFSLLIMALWTVENVAWTRTSFVIRTTTEIAFKSRYVDEVDDDFIRSYYDLQRAGRPLILAFQFEPALWVVLIVVAALFAKRTLG
jgi:hypothetical protein